MKIDLIRHAYHQVAPIDIIEGHQLISVPDLAAMKLNAIANRGSKKDFYDLAELLHHHTLGEMLRFFSTKDPATDPFAVIRASLGLKMPNSNPIQLLLQRRPGNKSNSRRQAQGFTRVIQSLEFLALDLNGDRRVFRKSLKIRVHLH